MSCFARHELRLTMMSSPRSNPTSSLVEEFTEPIRRCDSNVLLCKTRASAHYDEFASFESYLLLGLTYCTK